ncbi:hypothetical protein [Glycomyces artemisiae]|uniref:Terminase small subunit n=1 Tax=Glycomyces artemisiae TaxID=1076443 RepID=A0A2T0UES8_9ACTN|nr:hypothetical protein [Glycomyces artemisiae]PRY56451.1 hypothetical protein B0I28_109100 [Glycomyces artemisiae]
MPGQLPKEDPARRNKSTSKATLNPDHDVQAPLLPKGRTWDWQTESWWRDIWASPMASEYDDSDKHGLFRLAVLVDDYWTTDNANTRVKLAAEIRQQGALYGITPLDRRRLQWEVARGDEAEQKNRRRTAEQAPPATGDGAPPQPADPRQYLHLVPDAEAM